MDLELPEQYLLGAEPAVYAVYTLNGGAKQESTSVRVKAEITGLAELLEQSAGKKASSLYSGQDIGVHSVSFPVYDGTLLNFVRESRWGAP